MVVAYYKLVGKTRTTLVAESHGVQCQGLTGSNTSGANTEMLL